MSPQASAASTCDSLSTLCARSICKEPSMPPCRQPPQLVSVVGGQLGSLAPGDKEAVFAGLRAAFDAAKSFGPTVMVVTLSSGLSNGDTVAEIQRAVSH
jgi:hypothetical protein